MWVRGAEIALLAEDLGSFRKPLKKEKNMRNKKIESFIPNNNEFCRSLS